MSLEVPMEDTGKEGSTWGDCGLDKEALDLDWKPNSDTLFAGDIS